MKLSTRLTVAMVALVLLTATAVGFLISRNLEERALPRALDRIDTHAHLLALELEASVRSVRSDVLTQGGSVDGFVLARLAGGRHPLDGTSEEQWRQRLASRFVAELTAQPAYAQFRLIGVADGGREIVRVDRMGPAGAIRVVPAGQLQRKGDSDYFQAAIGLAPGEVYASPIDYNQENRAFELPYVPTLRVAALVSAPDGKPFGIMIINVDMRPEFAAIRSTESQNETIYVVNEQGDFLVHPDQSKEFAWQLGRPIRVQAQFPEFASLLGESDTLPRVMQDRSGGRFGVGWELVRLAGGPRISVIETVPYAQILSATTALPSVLGAIIAFIGALPLAVLLARSLSRPLVQMTNAVEAFSRGEPMAIPIDAKGEIGVLARAFARMATEVREKEASLKLESDERRAADERFQLAVEASPSGLIMIDSGGAIVLVNAETERMFGYRREELIGRSVDMLVSEQSRGYHAGHRARFVSSPEARRMGEGRDLFGVRKDGTEFPVEIGLNPIKTQTGPLILSVIVDISERKRAESEIRKYAEREQLFIAAVEIVQ